MWRGLPARTENDGVNRLASPPLALLVTACIKRELFGTRLMLFGIAHDFVRKVCNFSGSCAGGPMVEARRRKRDEAPLKGVRILIVESGYYADIADTLRAGAVRAIEASGAAHEVVTVPGALEIPQAIVLALDAARGAYDGVVALGCVIRG